MVHWALSTASRKSCLAQYSSVYLLFKSYGSNPGKQPLTRVRLCIGSNPRCGSLMTFLGGSTEREYIYIYDDCGRKYNWCNKCLASTKEEDKGLTKGIKTNKNQNYNSLIYRNRYGPNERKLYGPDERNVLCLPKKNTNSMS